MRRIRSTGCGYSLVPGRSYTCSGVAHLDDMFKTTPTNIFGTEVIRTTRSEEYSNEEWIGNPDRLLKGSIDNYAQLPQAFEGFVMTLTPVLDMAATNAGPEVPELECRINFDPFAKVVGSVLNTSPEYTSDSDTRNDGFLNLYNSVFPNYTKSVYVEAKTKEQLQTESVADSLIYYDMPAYLSGSTVTRQDGIGYVIQPNTDTETGNKSYVTLLAGPGILEPMLDTAFPPIGVDTITGPDIIGDFTMWEFNTIAQWQKTVDTRLNNIRIPSVTVDYGKVNGLINLENAKNQDGHCLNFQIQQTSVNPVIRFGTIGADTYPEYEITGGDVVVDGTTISNISSYTPPGAIFDAYLDIFKYGDTEDTMVLGATITDRYNASGFPVSTTPSTGIFQHKLFKYIGSVTQVTNTDSPVSGGTIYTLYEIKQGECLYEIALGGSTGGGGGGTCSCDYNGPFKVEPGAVGELNIVGIDSIEDIPYAGLVCYNGTDCTLADEGVVTGAATGDSIYANITGVGAAHVGYSLSQVTGTPPAYNVRLAKVTSRAITYNIVLGSTTGIDPNMVDHHITTLNNAITEDVIVTKNEDGTEFTLEAPTAVARILEVVDNVCTGAYQSNGTATGTAKDVLELTQIHHGDIYVDGRWT